MFKKLIGQRTFSTSLSRFLKASIDGNGKVVSVKEGSKNSLRFPGIWLRDNCQCEVCYSENAQSRRIDYSDFSFEVKAENVEITENKVLNVNWSDNHKSAYNLEWLTDRAFTKEKQDKYLTDFYRPPYQTWGKSKFKDVVKYFEFDDVLNDDKVLKEWIETLSTYGIALIRNTPRDKTVSRALANRIGFIRQTTYGEEYVVQAKPNATNQAYLSAKLQWHIDLPYYEYAPGVNLLHFYEQTKTKGGSNIIVDGFNIAERIKHQHPEDYKILCEVVVDWNDITVEQDIPYHNIWRAPVINLDADGNCTRINFSIPQRDSHFNVDVDKVIRWYEAFGKFVNMVKEETVLFKVNQGDILTFSNVRLLHGRDAYDDSDANVRYVVGAYMDWDIIYSKWRVLKNQLTNKY